MKQSSTFIPVACIVLLSLFSGCNLINPAEPIPSYIHIERIGLTTDYASQGSNSAKISDAWVYIDGKLQGCYELPVTFPVLMQGNHTVIVKAGIKINGIAATRAPYPFYEQYSRSITLTPGQIETLSPTVSYSSGVSFPWLEDFDATNSLQNSPSGSDTTIQLITIPSGSTHPDVYEGTGSAAAYLDTHRTNGEFICTPSRVLHGGTTPVFLEFNYKCNASFTVGMYSHGSASSVKTPILNFRSSEGWNKAYLYLTPTISAFPGDDYTVFFAMQNGIGMDSMAFVLDNIKLVQY